PALTTARIPRTNTPGVNPNARLSTSGQRGAVPAVKSKMPMYVGIGAAALLAIAATVLLIVKPWDKGQIDDPNNKKIPIQVVELSAKEKDFIRDDHNKAVAAVKDFIQLRNFADADIKYRRAVKADLEYAQQL